MPLSLVAAVFACAQPIFLGRTDAQAPASATASNDEIQTEEKPGDEISDPELIALTWQYDPQASHKRIRQPVWRPDGTRLTVAETDALLDDVKSFQTHWRQPEQLLPLVMIFRREGTIKTGLSLAVVLADGHRRWCGTWGPFLPNRLTTSACVPQVRDLAKWPEAIDVDVRVPLEEPQIIKTVQPVPEGAVEVAPGVRWYIDPERGIDKRNGKRRANLTAAVFEIENEPQDNLVTYDAAVRLRGKEAPLKGAYVTMIGPRPGVWLTLRVSKPLDDVNAIEKVEFTRQRFKILRLKEVKLRLDFLLPRGEVPDQADRNPKLKQEKKGK
ncbi:MAG TPA: hypothetical protein VFW87_09335 [Pirellulales bacterium]|nr:hypothetical protein [Pirellulales bacterium]